MWKHKGEAKKSNRWQKKPGVKLETFKKIVEQFLYRI